MSGRIRAARRDHRHGHRIGDRARERDVVADLGPVAVHAREEDLARAEADFVEKNFVGKLVITPQATG